MILLPLKRVAHCRDDLRAPVNATEREHIAGSIPYWGANKIQDYVDRALVSGPTVLLGEDGAPFFDPLRPVAFYVDEPIWPNNHIHVLKPRRSIDGRWLAYALNTVDYRLWITGATRDKLTQDAMMRMEILVPSTIEQRAIADYLDRETAKIDTLIEKQTTMIERLRERRAAVVRSSVLGEVSANRAATPYWFGRIPSHWQTPRLSHHHHVVLGRMINASQALDTDISVPYVAAGSIQPEELILDAARTLTVPAADVAKYSLRRGDVVVVEGGAGYGRSHWLPTDIPGWAFQNHVVRVRPRDSTVDSRYTRLVIETCRQSGFFEANNRTATLPSLSSEVLGALRIPLPPLDEQRAIADYLDRGTAKIDTLIAKVERHIELAKERRAALITAAVTGQIDVTTSTQSGDAA